MSSRAEEKERARVTVEHGAGRTGEAAALRRRRLLTLAGVLAAAAIVVAVAIAASRAGSNGPKATPGETAALLAGIPQTGPFLGRPDAPFVVEEFADLQCPFCARAAGGLLPTLIRDYVRPGRVRLRFRTLTFIGPDSVTAGRAAVAAGLQDRQWGFVERFYAEQRAENSGYVTDAFLRAVAGGVPGLDAGRMLAARAAPAVDRTLSADRAAAQYAAVEATPTFLAGRRGGKLAPLALTDLSATALHRALDPVVR